MTRRRPPSNGIDPREIEQIVDASVDTFQRLNRRAQLTVVVLLVALGVVAAVIYFRSQHGKSPGVVATDNLLLGNPSGAGTADRNNWLMVKPYYVLSYNDERGTPNWVSWQVTAADLGDAARKQVFDPDPDMPAGMKVVKTSDYSGSGFDRGHMCPHSDRAANIEMSYATFVMTNVIPQAPNVNQKAWAQFEVYCRDLVKAHNRLYVISGPTGEGGTGSKGFKRSIGNGKVTVPSGCWKVVVVVPDDGGGGSDLARISVSTRVIAVDMPNDNNAVGDAWDIFRTTPGAIELKTGLRFFDQVRSDVAGVLREKLDSEPIAPPRPLTHDRGPV